MFLTVLARAHRLIYVLETERVFTHESSPDPGVSPESGARPDREHETSEKVGPLFIGHNS